MIPPIFKPGVMPTWEEQCQVKCLAIQMTQAALDGDMQAIGDLIPEGQLDTYNALGTLALITATVIRAHVGDDKEAQQKILDTCREVITGGRGL